MPVVNNGLVLVECSRVRATILVVLCFTCGKETFFLELQKILSKSLVINLSLFKVFENIKNIIKLYLQTTIGN